MDIIIQFGPRATRTDSASSSNCFDDSFPFDGLETEYMQLKYYKEHFNYMVCKLIPVIRKGLW